MDFSKINIIKALESAMPNRFQDFPPSDFEDFISQLFKDNGYNVEQTSYSGDFGADLILEKNEERIAVQVKRYAKDNKVGVKDVNQIIGAKVFYKCNKARIITTSSFSKPGKELSLTTQTDAWDWDRLQKYICDTYLDGKDYYKFFKGDFYIKNGDRKFEFEVKKVEYNIEMKKVGLCTLIYANMKNLTNNNISVSLEYPIYISQDNKQTEAIYWYQGYFYKGTIYAGCSSEVSFMYKSEQLPIVRNQDKIIFKWYDEHFNLTAQECMITRDYFHSSRTPDYFQPSYGRSSHASAQTSGCYIVTMCYGRNSKQYSEMIYFRDNLLLNYDFGKLTTNMYYRYSQCLVSKLKKYSSTQKFSKFILKGFLVPITIINKIHRK